MGNLIKILIRTGPYEGKNSRGDTVSAMIKKSAKKNENFEIYTL